MNSKNGTTKSEFFKKNKMLIISILAALIGILLIIFPYFFGSPKEDECDYESGKGYADYIEDKLKSTLEGALGKNSVEVMVTTSSFYEKKFSGESLQEKSKAVFSFSEQYHISESTELPVVSTDAIPEIRGVMIICKKNINSSYLRQIKLAVSTALNINQSQIYIIGGTDNEKNS